LTFSIPELTRALRDDPIQPLSWQVAIFLGLFAGFAIKVPLFPLHTWLPLAHVQAPTAGSVFLAGILLKIGTYGFLRFNVAMLPDATAVLAPWMLWLAVLGIIYGALVALAQRDIKRLIAYSSVSHLGYCVLGIFALNRLGVQGGTLQMINHGISTGALFALVGMLYERYHTREISQYGGLAKRLPWLAFFMLVFTFSSIGLPGMNGFAGEFMILLGMFQMAWGQDAAVEGLRQYRIISVLAVSGVVLGAWYMLWMVQRVFFGPLREPQNSHGSEVQDLNRREVLALTPLAILVVWIGIQPGFFLKRMGPSLDRLTSPARVTWEDNQLTSRNAPVMHQVSVKRGPERENSSRVR
jgi:NADH-quinone oxidoreductase subunit M